MYSVEWIPDKDPWDCWNQHSLTSNKWSARLHLLELKLMLAKSGNHCRTRVRNLDEVV